MIFPNDHPLVSYNNKIFITSGTPNKPIYIFRFAKYGAKVELTISKNDVNKAVIKRLIFGQGRFDYEFTEDEEYGCKCINDISLDNLYEKIANKLEVIEYGAKKQNR